MQVAPSVSTYAPAPGDVASLPAPGSAFNSYTDQPQDNAGAFADNGSGGYSQPDSQYPHAAPIDSTPGDTLALMVQAQTKPLLVTPENAQGLNPPPPADNTAPASATTPTASPTEIAALELLLAEPANQDIIA
ncbi:MAG: hypothetical protein K0M68_02825, partial [Acidovorax sp.]|nr:hypothetical protein [Acidovorax sp.]